MSWKVRLAPSDGLGAVSSIVPALQVLAVPLTVVRVTLESPVGRQEVETVMSPMWVKVLLTMQLT